MTDISPQLRAYLIDVLERNVFWWGVRQDWDLMFQYEVLDRGLLNKEEAVIARELMEERRNA